MGDFLDEHIEEILKNEPSPKERINREIAEEHKRKVMSHLSYVYIFEYRNLKNIGLSFDPRFDVSVDKDNNNVSIKRTSSVPASFWGDNVNSVAAIVGNNGAGKSTLLRFLLEALVDGSGSRKDLRGIIIEANEEEHLKIYVPEDLLGAYNYESEHVQVDGIASMDRLTYIETFYYGSHFNALSTQDDILTQEWRGFVNASDGFLLAKDLQDYGNELSTNGYFSFRDYATAYNSQNQYRICYFLNRYNGGIKSELKLPRYVLIFPNTAGQWAINHRMRLGDKIKLPDYEIPRGWDEKNQLLCGFIYHAMINFMADRRGTPEQWIPLIEQWQQKTIGAHGVNVVDEYLQFVRVIGDKECQLLCGYIYECVNMLSETCRLHSALRSWLYYDIEEDKAAISMLLEWIVNHKVYVTSRFFDMYYAHNFSSTTFLSSGEQELLNTYSRIFDSVIRLKDRGFSENTPQLFIFDEAEIGYHPEWQRKFINNIVLFINDLSKFVEQKSQIIITTHSPIILSDIPVECCNILKYGVDGETINVNYNRKQTFGSNVFELYRNSFFLEGGMVGEFAQNKLKQLEEAIDAGDITEKIRQTIALIGDERIQDYMLKKIAHRDVDAEIAYHEERIRQLRMKRDHRNE